MIYYIDQFDDPCTRIRLLVLTTIKDPIQLSPRFILKLTCYYFYLLGNYRVLHIVERQFTAILKNGSAVLFIPCSTQSSSSRLLTFSDDTHV